ncbi:MAG: phytanoyl-CoA dioxygenase family protein [Phycisphaeraceae bacterium]|nr:phytanoyl-CoA dioxygenase family protein [Phycisphaeraceae bacterium]
MAVAIEGFVDSTALFNDPLALRYRAEEDGFLFFRSLLPKEPLLELRRQIVTILARRGWLRPGTDPMEAIVDRDMIARTLQVDESLIYIGVPSDVYKEIQCLELFHTLPHHPKLIEALERMFGQDVFVHPRHIARVLIPSDRCAATPPHQDYTHIQGTHQFWTCWFPLGDCPMDLGGLSMLRGSNKEGVLPVTAAAGAGGVESILCGKSYDWVQDDYALGDAMFFPSHTVHRGLPNQHHDRIRISLDLRYQPAGQEIEHRSLQPHVSVVTWEEIYAGWTSDKLKYYWHGQPMRLTEYDIELVKNQPRIC